MLRLGVATRAETFERMVDPLTERGIAVEHVPFKERTLPLSDPDLPDVDVGFVYPSRVMEGGVVDAALGVPWVNDREAVLTSRNKAGVLASLSRAGLPVPETTMVSNPCSDADLRAAASDLGYPLVVKPNSATRGVGIARVDDEDSLLGVVDYLDAIHDFRATGDKSYLLQEYLPDARDYRAMVIDGECVGGVERRLPEAAAGRWKHNVHRGATATGVDLPGDHRRLAEETAAALGISYLGVDVLETPSGPLVNETNARPTIDEAAKYDDGFYEKLAGLVRRVAGN
jgi:ribosomal protein S6--L-glutamate ligase